MPKKSNLTYFVIPIRDDYESVRQLLIGIRKSNKNEDGLTLNYRVLLVDDGSEKDSLNDQDNILGDFPETEILKLESRLGHQTAIFRGLQRLASSKTNPNVVILDGDGEDRPSDAIHLARQLILSGTSVICAKRLSRDVGTGFKIGYRIFTWVFRRLVGFDFRSGNFMAISSEYLDVVLNFSGIRNHVAASVVRYSSDLTFQEFNRGSRFAGKSKMNLANLTLHGYGAFSVFADILLARICMFLLTFSSFVFSLVILLVTLRFFNLLNVVSGWTSIVLVQLVSLFLLLTTNSILILLLLLKIDKKD